MNDNFISAVGVYVILFVSSLNLILSIKFNHLTKLNLVSVRHTYINLTKFSQPFFEFTEVIEIFSILCSAHIYKQLGTMISWVSIHIRHFSYNQFITQITLFLLMEWIIELHSIIAVYLKSLKYPGVEPRF